jgi:hypothetical protein
MRAVIFGVVVLASLAGCAEPAAVVPCANIDCGPHGTCVAAGGGARCECAAGYQQRGSRCEEALDAGAPDAYVPGCGSGAIDPGERCDGHDLGGATCASLGFAGGTLACKDDCAFDTRGCATTCGDGLMGGIEACDGTEFGGTGCRTYGFYDGTLRCSADCWNVDVSGCSRRCGDFVVDADRGEQCDGTNLGTDTCLTLGFYHGELACQADCHYDLSGCTGTCGDGVVDPAYEECDGTEFNGKTCQDYGFIGGWLTCDFACDSISTVHCQ